MARRDSAAFERAHTRGEDATLLAALITRDGMWERVDGHTPVDEAIEAEADMGLVEPTEAGVVIVPVEDYEVMRQWMVAHGALTDRALPRLEWPNHKHAQAGWVVISEEDFSRAIRTAKVHTFLALMRYVWQGSGNLWAAMRNLLAITHKNSPQFIGGMSGAEIGKFLGIGRAAFNKHSIKTVVDYLERWGVKGGTAGGSKPHDHREKKRAQMQGRRHRAKDYVPDAPAEPVLTPAEKEARTWRVRQLRAFAEKKRMAALCGCAPEDIDLDKITPTETAA